MLVRPITKEERLQSAQLFAIAFESPFDPNDLTPFAENPCIWAAFDEESGEMMSTVYVTDYRVQFDGGRYKMGGIGGVAGAALLGVIYPRLFSESAAHSVPRRLCLFLSLSVLYSVLPEIWL